MVTRATAAKQATVSRDAIGPPWLAEKPAVATPSDAPATIALEIIENASARDPSALITPTSDPTVP